MKPYISCVILLVGIASTRAERFSQACLEQSWEDNIEYEEPQVICPEEKPLKYDKPNMCAYWCKYDDAKYAIEHSRQGRVAFFIPPSPQHCKFNRYLVELLISDNEAQGECTSTTFTSFKKHSVLEFDISRNSTANCVKNEIKLDFSYLFTGCYRIRITPYIDTLGHTSTHQRCIMNPNFVSTDYVMSQITEPSWKAINVDSSRKAVTIISGGGLFSAMLVVVTLYNYSSVGNDPISCCSPDHRQINIRLKHSNKHDTNNSTEKRSYYFDTRPHNSLSSSLTDGLISYENTPPAIINDDGCNCVWISGQPYTEMQCSFYNLITGSYKVTIKVYDPRCESYTIWTEPHNHPCLWSANHSFVAANDTNYTVMPSDDTFIYLWVISGLIIVILISAVVIVIVTYLKSPPRNQEWQVEEDLLIHKISFQNHLNDKTRILLMYPRDCQTFMDSMNAFRNLLKCTGKFEVLDALDSEYYEEVAASSSTWGLKEIADPSTKVVLIASWCSLKMYDALLGKETLCYKETEPFDTLFLLHLNQLFQQKEPYKKIYVVRLDCDDAEKLWFEHIVQSRVYTLPQCLESLVNALLELPDLNITFDDNLEKSIAKLKSLIETYSTYCREHPDYLSSLVEFNPINETSALILRD